MNTTSAATNHHWRRNVTWCACILFALGLMTWRSWPDGRVHVFFPEAKGDAALIQTPTGGYVLIDGGADPAALTAALGRRMPFWRRTLDAVVLTVPDRTHLPGQVAALARYRADLALTPDLAARGATMAEWRRLLAEQQTPVRSARAGERIDLGGATLRVLALGNGDESGLLLRLDYGATSVVFDHVGDEHDEKVLAAEQLATASLLVFPWQRDPHGAFVAALQPQALLLTDGQSVERPVEQTFAERAVGGAQLFHESLDGTVEWISDGTRSWVVTER